MAAASRDYRRSLSALYRLQVLGTKLGLKNIRHLLRLMGDPHQEMDFFHLAGTNGKGSTGVFLQALLGLFDERVGLYTSPHLEDFRERIRIGNELIPPEAVIGGLSRIRPLFEIVESYPDCSHPTFFEAVTALACDYFHSRGVKSVVWETGMGGRLDATNVVRPRVAVISNVRVDHSAYLGRGLAAIAREKGGIIKKGIPLVTAENDPAVLAVLERICRRKDSRLVRARDYCRVILRGPAPGGQKIDLQTPFRLRRGLVLPLIGPHQAVNFATAWAAAAVVVPGLENVSTARIQTALGKARWPGRFEVFKDLKIILDGAHNPGGAEALAEALDYFLPGEKVTMILGVLKDKDAEGICRRLSSRASTVIAVTPPGRRGRPARELAEICRRIASGDGPAVEAVSSPFKALDKIMSPPARRGWACVAGSLRLIGELRSKIMGR